ncbi:phenylalanine--tRNA ligase subunit beta [Sulfurospirillum sp. T05]|uniref:Phenylalanine--tRNA ligase beta subunit n=1 Tax=Sulfurospirillum tamanense TaxID=2813362 RepID=A0ABS2WPI2_9BACT|nr:phenylalanine--tRNA ligase subunit beta [Sulfurospirillum tamanensis]MBN2963612.1 phenylalanine--tRNA ligase subunit beta [Sulfurospirillum tamanensis]
MIVTREWLREWIDLEGITTQALCETLNAIGLEVDGLTQQRIPEGVVVGYVVNKTPHPDAQKLNVCQVDVGQSVPLQIVCGAANVAQGQYVPVALEGAVLPDGLEIAPTLLRGITSTGMICSSTELGLPKINDGIMVLDESIGTLTIGQPLCEIQALNDDVIEIGLTPNRGDCLSIRGVARDLSVIFKRPLLQHEATEEEENQLGIGRILSLHVEDKVESSFVYKAFEKQSMRPNVLRELRLAQVEIKLASEVERAIEYATYATGVLMRAYDYACFVDAKDKATVSLKKDTNGIDAVFGINGRVAYVGFSQEATCRTTDESKIVIVEANFSSPERMATLGAENKTLSSDKHLYRSARGSEPELEIGMEYLWALLQKEKGVSLYAGAQKFTRESKPSVVILSLDELSGMIGQEIPKNHVVDILKRLGFEVHVKVEQEIIHVSVPAFRHDVLNAQDLCEEIVRMVGIDNITAKPLVFAEKSRTNQAYVQYKFRTSLRQRAAAVGFFESVHYLFDERKKQEHYGIKGVYKKRELSNPITSELNTMRSTLALHLLESASKNIKNGKKRVPLFELGRVFDRSRNETTKIGFIFSGESEEAALPNHGKPNPISLMGFASKLSQVVGQIRLEEGAPTNKLTSPYEYANVIVDGICVGFLARVHAQVEKDFDLPRTYIAELDVEALHKERVIASEYSKFPSSSRDLSLLMPKSMSYARIRACIEEAGIANLSQCYPIDRFESADLGEQMSLTIKLIFQHKDRTLEEKEISQAVEAVLKTLHVTLGIGMR